MKRVLFFGTYDVGRHPRVRVLQEGFATHGWIVEECNIPLEDTTEDRVALLERPWRAPAAALRVRRSWRILRRRARRTPPPDVVVVGYLGHFDVRLARRLWPNRPIVLDQLAFAADTAVDRRARSQILMNLLERVDRDAMAAADLVVLDTEEAGELVPEGAEHKTVVVPVGSPSAWYKPPSVAPAGPMRVVFFGLYTPLQGAPVIGRAIALLSGTDVEFTMIGRGQDLDATRTLALPNRRVTWLDWVGADTLPEAVAAHDVCLGIFGTGPKGSRVVPNKVYQGAAAGCAVITSNTPVQRAALGNAAIYVAPGEAGALAAAIYRLADDPRRLWAARCAAYERAEVSFRPDAVVTPLLEALEHHIPASSASR
jgi:glycosyltransferase involved in cell wall biosynthesis